MDCELGDGEEKRDEFGKDGIEVIQHLSQMEERLGKGSFVSDHRLPKVNNLELWAADEIAGEAAIVQHPLSIALPWEHSVSARQKGALF